MIYGIEIGSELFYQIIYTIVIIIGTFIISRMIKRTVNKFTQRAKIEKHLAAPIIKVINVIIYIGALTILLGIWGLKGQLAGLLAGAGIAGIVIGFATKDILSDLLAGILLFFDRPFKIGDSINIEGLWGSVQDIGIRSTKIKTFDGKFVTIPNSKIAKSIITNVSVYEGRRLKLTVGVDYDTDLKKAKKAIEKAVKRLEKAGMIMEDPKPRVFIESFGDSSINFKIVFWYNAKYAKEHDMWFKEIKGELIDAIKREFEKESITIPFPQITLSERKKKRV